MPSCGINFRATSGFVTDSAGETYCLATDSYPTTRGGFTFGWTAGTQDARDRNSGIDRRLAGMGFFSGEQGQWRFDLPATGSTDIRLALGDDSNDQHAACLITDNGSTLATISDVLVTGSHFVDASGTDRTEAAWPGSNAAFTGTFSTTTCILKIGVVAGGNNYPIAHFDFNQAATSGPEQNSDFPNPRGPRFPQEDRGFLNGAEVQLIGQDKFFGGAGEPPTYDWPVPKGRQPAIALKTFIHNSDIQLIGKDQMFGAAGEVPSYDWPNPRGRQYPIDSRSWLINLLESTLGIVFPKPFNQGDWPNPRGPRYPLENRTFLNALEIQLQGQDRIFGAPGQVPTYPFTVPAGPRSNDLRTWYVNILCEPVTVVVPPSIVIVQPTSILLTNNGTLRLTLNNNGQLSSIINPTVLSVKTQS